MGFDNECIQNIQSLPGEYFCPVCRTLVYPSEALQAQCTHLYCKPCLAYVVATTRACPYDGYLVTDADSKPLLDTINRPIVDAINKIQVHCLFHRSGCQWQGSFIECIAHCTDCNFGNSPVVCNRCGTQIIHRQVQDHAQICPGVQPQAQQADNTQTQTSVQANQVISQTSVQSTAVPSASMGSTASASIPAANSIHVSSSVVSTLPHTVPPSDQSSQQQQMQNQQYYQQYPLYLPQEQSQQQFPQSQIQTQQVHVIQGQQYPQPYIYPQHQAQQQLQTHTLPNVQQQSQSGPSPPQVLGHVSQIPQGAMPTHHTQPQIYVQSHQASQGQAQVLQIGHSHPQAQPYPQAQPQPQPQLQPQLHPQPQLQPQPHPQAPQHFPPTQVLHPLPPPNSQHQPPPAMQHPPPQSQHQTYPQQQQFLQPLQQQPHPLPQPQNYSQTQPQSQHPSIHTMSAHQSYLRPQTPQQMFPGVSQQNPMHAPAQQGLQNQSQHHLHVQGQFPPQHLPQMRPLQSNVPMQVQQTGVPLSLTVPHQNQPHALPQTYHNTSQPRPQQQGVSPHQTHVEMLPQHSSRPQGLMYTHHGPAHPQTQGIATRPLTGNPGAMQQQLPYTHTVSSSHMQHSSMSGTAQISSVQQIGSAISPNISVSMTDKLGSATELRDESTPKIPKAGEAIDSSFVSNAIPESTSSKTQNPNCNLNSDDREETIAVKAKNGETTVEGKENKEGVFANVSMKEELDEKTMDQSPRREALESARGKGEEQSQKTQSPAEEKHKVSHEREVSQETASQEEQKSIPKLEIQNTSSLPLSHSLPNSNVPNDIISKVPPSDKLPAPFVTQHGLNQGRRLPAPPPNQLLPQGQHFPPNLTRPPFPENLPHPGHHPLAVSDPFKPPMRPPAGTFHPESQSGFNSSCRSGPVHFGIQKGYEHSGMASHELQPQGHIPPFQAGTSMPHMESLSRPPFLGPPHPGSFDASSGMLNKMPSLESQRLKMNVISDNAESFGSGEGKFRTFPQERFKSFPMERRNFEDDLKQFLGPGNLNGEGRKFGNYMSESRSNERSSHLLGIDNARLNPDVDPRNLPAYVSDGPPAGGSSGSYFHPLGNGERQRLHALHDDNIGKKNEPGHTDIFGHAPDFGNHHMDSHPFRGSGRDFGGFPQSRYNMGIQGRFEDYPKRELLGFDERARFFNHPESRISNLPSPSQLPNHFMRSELSGRKPEFFPSHPRNNELFGSQTQLRRDEYTPNLYNRESIGGQQHFGEVEFSGNFSAHGSSIHGDTFDQSKKRKFDSIGWCRICKIDCETIEGLDLHSQTREHQKIAMDIVLNIKKGCVQKKKLSVKDNVKLDEVNKSNMVVIFIAFEVSLLRRSFSHKEMEDVISFMELVFILFIALHLAKVFHVNGQTSNLGQVFMGDFFLKVSSFIFKFKCIRQYAVCLFQLHLTVIAAPYDAACRHFSLVSASCDLTSGLKKIIL